LRTFKAPAVIACEGEADKAFLLSLIQRRTLGTFDVEIAQGKDFREFLTAIPIQSGVTKVLIVSDSDDAPEARFDEIRKQIVAAGLGAPTKPLEVSHRAPAVGILLIPWFDKPGNLETLCLPFMMEKYPEIAKCVDEYFSCCHLAKWSLGKQSKMRFACVVAAACERDPTRALRYLWGSEEFCIDSSHAYFDRVAEAIRTFGAA